MKMKIKPIIVLLCAVLLLSQIGCRLAVEESGSNSEEYKFVGFFITTEHVDMNDFDENIDNNNYNFSYGSISNPETLRYKQDRLYATRVLTQSINENNGQYQGGEYDFAGLEGIPFFITITPYGNEDNDTYLETHGGSIIDVEGVKIINKNDERATELEGKLYVLTETYTTFFGNPVFQSTDGSIFMQNGIGIANYGYQSGGLSEGVIMSLYRDEVYTITENGKSITERFSINLEIYFINRPETIVIMQMNNEGLLLNRDEYQAGALPEEIIALTDTYFIVVETIQRDIEGNIHVSHEIYNNDSDIITTFSARKDGICIKVITKIIWIDS